MLMAPNVPTSVWAWTEIPHSTQPKMQRVFLIRLEIIRGQPVSMNGFDGKSALFPDAKLAENGVEQILGGGFPDHFPDGVDSDAQVHGDELEICRST